MPSLPDLPQPARGTGPQVLLVDDSEISLRMLQKRVAQLGLGVKVARSGQEALKCVAAEQFTHVLVDTMRSEMDSFDTCRAIRQHSFAGGQAPRLVLLANVGGSADRSRARLAGCDDYLLKPIGTKALTLALGLNP
jgi:CheY-like chemotaxis protein